jgi:hypothetical protein
MSRNTVIVLIYHHHKHSDLSFYLFFRNSHLEGNYGLHQRKMLFSSLYCNLTILVLMLFIIIISSVSLFLFVTYFECKSGL